MPNLRDIRRRIARQGGGVGVPPTSLVPRGLRGVLRQAQDERIF